ncbi:MAG TPA: alkaline phosphatase family protein [Pyrinomonadaceae bacterium]|nr:alkaline phosphatase family protein [Pyrinomonadaceae bacterium]
MVIIRVDGLPYGLLDSFAKERDQHTGKSRLPWIDHVFYQRGARLSNFYTRGMSLSAPSWSLLDTGQHLQIKGNVEFDRYTLHTYDYLNFIPFYLKSAAGQRIDMPGTEVLDSLGLPLLFDAFAHEDRYIGFQLYQRGMRFATLKDAMQTRFMKRPRELLDEWTMGLDMRTPFFDQMERELKTKLNDPNSRYLDIYVTGFDHVAHHVNDRRSHFSEMQIIDALVGRIWTAIQKAPQAQETALIVISDHGFNTSEGVYSQGYNLVKLLGSPAGGGHHVITKRRLMLDYSLKGINFLVPLITTTTDDSFYLTGQSTNYPTALLDFDGNERASIHLRDSDLNLLHILLQQLQRNKKSPAVRSALVNEFFKTIDNRRAEWQNSLDELNQELVALRVQIDKQRQLWEAEPKKFSPEEIRLGRDDQKKRVYAQLERWMSQEKSYTEYTHTLGNLLALLKESFAADKLKLDKLKIEDLIAKQTMGERNSVYDLQNYIVGLTPGGLQVKPDGSLDMVNSFRRVDYLALLHSIAMRNNVQPKVTNKPIDMIATRLSSALVAPVLGENGLTADVVWVYGGRDKQALILARENERGTLSLRYQPIRNLRQDAGGRVHFEAVNWEPGFPLHIFEDSELDIPSGDRHAWLSQWHTDVEWLRALHKTKYSNGLIGLYEEIARHPTESLALDAPGLSNRERLMRRFARRQRELIETDLLLIANDHWNFDVRGFNPGGNHGSFFRISTRSTFMLAGGDGTGIPHARLIEEPYDSLSFAPTVLALTGNLRDDNSPVSTLWNKGFRRFPGRVVREVLRNQNPKR